MIKWSKRGLEVQKQANARVVAFLVKRDGEIRARANRKLVGCNLGFRQHAGLVDEDEQQAIRDGEDSRLIAALRHNGAHPRFQNGPW